MGLLLVFFNSFVIGFSGAVMPGPLLVVGIAETPRSGWKTGPIISVGHAIAEIFVVVLLALGASLLATMPIVAQSIAIVGGLALIIMAVMMIRDTLGNRLNYSVDDTDRKSSSHLAGKGITATLSNPYWFIWWATVGLALLMQSQQYGIWGPIAFYFGHILSDFFWYTLVTIIIWKGRSILIGTGMKILLLSCSAFLLYLGGLFVINGIRGQI